MLTAVSVYIYVRIFPFVPVNKPLLGDVSDCDNMGIRGLWKVL